MSKVEGKTTKSNGHSATQHSKPAQFKPHVTQMAQRAKENGNSSHPEGEQVQLKKNVLGQPAFIQPNPILQARLKMGSVGDKYEREADSVADKVVSNNDAKSVDKAPAPPVQTTKVQSGDLQKKEAPMKGEVQLQTETVSDNDSVEANSGFEDQLSKSKGGGSKLTPDVQSEMEAGIGSNFSNVKVHTDANAVQMNDKIGAKAFANGNDVYFNKGQFDPASKKGKHLLAHELTHTIQQNGAVQKKDQNLKISKTNKTVQRSWWGKLWSSAKSIGNKLWDGAKKIGGAFASAWNTAKKYVGEGAKWVWDGIKSLGKGAWNWLKNAGKKTWQAIKWFGNKSWKLIQTLGVTLWKKLVWVGSNAWYFISQLPARAWRYLVHGWEGIIGIFKWAWKGVKGFGNHAWKAISGTWSWLKEGVWGGARWIGEGLYNGKVWAMDFIKAPSWTKLWSGLAGTVSWLGKGAKDFSKWGWKGIQGLGIWAKEGLKGLSNWIWDGIVGGLEWQGKNFMLILDLLGTGERLQIIYGLFAKMRKLTSAEISASQMVHKNGMIPYDLIRVDEHSVVSKMGNNRPVTTMHIIHSQGGINPDVMVHELTHVAQYEHVGSVYMPEALIAQHKYGSSGGKGRGSAYDYERTGALSAQRARGGKFKDLNRESQAQLVQDYYILKLAKMNTTDYDPYIKDMNNHDF